MEPESTPQKACTLPECPRHRSLCCDAPSQPVESAWGIAFFACSSCHAEFIGGQCDCPPAFGSSSESADNLPYIPPKRPPEPPEAVITIQSSPDKPDAPESAAERPQDDPELAAEAAVLGISVKQLLANRANAQLGGKPKGSISESTKMKRMMRQILVQRVHDQFDELIDAKFDLAKGHWEYVKVFNETSQKKETKRVYKTSPDAKSLEYLIDQVVGKPTSKIAFEEAENLDDIEVTEEEQNQINFALKNLKAFQKSHEDEIMKAQHAGH